MATLPSETQAEINTGLQRYWSRFRQSIPVSSAQLLAAVEATDSWIDSNQAGFNVALPEAFRTAASVEQKTFLFCVVALARVSIALLISIVGKVD